MQVVLRDYVDGDIECLMAMMTALIDAMSRIDPFHLFYPAEQFNVSAYAAERLKNVRAKKGTVILAFVDDKAAGYVMATLEDTNGVDALNKIPVKKGIIDALFVSDAYRGQGISTALLDAVEEYFRSHGCGYSEVSALARNETARNVYLKKGYTEQYIDFLKRL